MNEGENFSGHADLLNDARQEIGSDESSNNGLKSKDVRMAYLTGHLQNYEVLDDLIALEGADYTPIKKGVWYSIVGALKPQAVRFGNIRVDTRFNILIVLPSGSGKDNFKRAIRTIMQKCDLAEREPSIFVPDQLIGKVIERGRGKEKEWVKNPGYLSKDFIIFNEVFGLLTEKDKQYEESRALITKALDTIGGNTVFKLLINNLDVEEERLEYDPHCSVAMFLQPRYIPEDVVSSGFLRRLNILYVPMVGKNLDRDTEMVNYIKRVHTNVSFEYWEDITKWNRWSGNERGVVDFQFEDGIADLLVVLEKDLVRYVRQLGEKQRAYLDRNRFPLPGVLIKMAVIQAISKKSDTVTREDVELAYTDLFEFFNLAVGYVDAKVIGNLDYGERWHGADTKEVEALKWLVRRGALNEESSNVMIREFKGEIANIFGIEERSAERHYQKLKNRRLIDSRRVEGHGSKIWICFDPDRDTFEECVLLSETVYWNIVQRQVRNLEPIASEQVRKYAPEKNDSDGASTTSTQVRRGGHENTGVCAVLRTCSTCSTDGDMGDLQVRNQPADSDFGENEKTLSGGTKNDLGDLQVRTPITEPTQYDRMNRINDFFQSKKNVNMTGDELASFVSEIAEKLGISEPIARRSVMEYGRERGWV